MNYATATANLLATMTEQQQKAVYNFLTVIKDQQSGDKAIPTTNNYPTEIYNRYDHNETMRILGQQCIMRLWDDAARNGANDILTAYGITKGFKGISDRLYNMILDLFVFGYISGKRAERARKKATTPTTK